MKKFITRGLLGVLVFALTISLMTSLAYSKKEASFQGHVIEEGVILVKFKPNTTPTRISSITKTAAAKVLYSSSDMKDQRLAIIPNFFALKVDNAKFKQTLSSLASSPEVEYAHPNYQLYPTNFPNDPSFLDQWNLNNFEYPPGSGVGQTGGTPGADIRAPWGWERQTGSRSVVVATVDTGVDYKHTDLAGNIWVNQSEIPGNGLDDDNNGYVDDVHGVNMVDYYVGGAPCAGDPMDDNGHGTHVAGIIGACGNNGRGISGVNWNVSIMATKFMDSTGQGWLEDAILCLQYIRAEKLAGVNIIAANNSWGGGGYSRALYDAIKALEDVGVLFVAAAGNEWVDNDSYLSYPASYDRMNVISVAATDFNDDLAWFSNYGSRTVDVGAPGVDILSTCSALCPYCWSTDAWPYDTWSGTSMAAAHVTGLAALLKAQDPTRTWKQIRNLILSSGKHLPSLDGITVTGMRLDAQRALTSPSDARLFAILNPADSVLTGKLYSLYSPIDFELHNIVGANPAGAVTCTINNTIVNLLDDGIFPDKVADDGVYSARWTPPRVGDFALVFRSESDGLSKTVDIIVTLLPPRYTIGEVPYSFTDISGTGLPLYMSDEIPLWLSLPFPITMYGWQWDWLFVSDNGAASVDGTYIDWDNWPLPNMYYGNVVAPFWDDFDPESGGEVYVGVVGTTPNRSLIVQWNDIPHYNLVGITGTNGVTFQTVFHENNPDIEWNYKDVVFGEFDPPGYDYGRSATIGIQDWYAENATQYSFCTPSLKDNLSLELTASEYAYPQLSVEPYYLDFGCVLKRNYRDQPVYLYNKGNIPLTVTALTLSGTAEYKLATKLPYGGLKIPAGEYGKIMVRYTPINDGSDYASISVKSTGGNSALSIYGWGLDVPDIDLSGTKIDFGEVAIGDSYDHDLTIQNKGSANLRIDYIDIEAPFSIDGALPPYTLAPGSSITINLLFSPEEEGSFLNKIAIFSNDPDEPAVLVPLAGVGSTFWP